jgi:hypothetical protein
MNYFEKARYAFRPAYLDRLSTPQVLVFPSDLCLCCTWIVDRKVCAAEVEEHQWRIRQQCDDFILPRWTIRDTSILC